MSPKRNGPLTLLALLPLLTNSTIPRSTRHSSSSPPWNPSPQISPDGYLSRLYPRTPGTWEPSASLRGKHGPRSRRYASLLSTPARLRQVPGDGNCLFHSIAASLSPELRMDTPEGLVELKEESAGLRRAAVDLLECPRRRLFLQGEEYLDARELLRAAAAQFDMEGEEYCRLMRKESYWGGGPEIVALCNYLQRPIHIYELIPTEEITQDDTNNKNKPSPLSPTPSTLPISTKFTLRRMACFGSPKFDRREPLHILSADSRFPDVDPRKIRRVGNHFLALFPLEEEVIRKRRLWSGEEGVLRRRHALIRGGTEEGGGVSGARDGGNVSDGLGTGNENALDGLDGRSEDSINRFHP